MAREHRAPAVLNAWHSCHAAVLARHQLAQYPFAQYPFAQHQLGSSVAVQTVVVARVAAFDSMAVIGLFCEIPP